MCLFLNGPQSSADCPVMPIFEFAMAGLLLGAHSRESVPT
jgi:hypothetical protein